MNTGAPSNKCMEFCKTVEANVMLCPLASPAEIARMSKPVSLGVALSSRVRSVIGSPNRWLGLCPGYQIIWDCRRADVRRVPGRYRGMRAKYLISRFEMYFFDLCLYLAVGCRL